MYVFIDNGDQWVRSQYTLVHSDWFDEVLAKFNGQDCQYNPILGGYVFDYTNYTRWDEVMTRLNAVWNNHPDVLGFILEFAHSLDEVMPMIEDFVENY